jgi:hypothetical protein
LRAPLPGRTAARLRAAPRLASEAGADAKGGLVRVLVRVLERLGAEIARLSARIEHAFAGSPADEDAQATMAGYNQRGDASENRIKALKIGFGMNPMRCGTFEVNAVFFAIGALTYNPKSGS